MSRYLQQVYCITAAAAAVEAGTFQSQTLDEVAARSDELGRLARVFQRMTCLPILKGSFFEISQS